jgi:hypothetical protein
MFNTSYVSIYNLDLELMVIKIIYVGTIIRMIWFKKLIMTLFHFFLFIVY